MTHGKAHAPPGRIPVPAPQDAIPTVLKKAVAALSDQSAAQLEWLGAERCGSQWRLPVLDAVLLADLGAGDVFRADGKRVRPPWQILTLHYLAVRTRPARRPPEVTFASFPSARTYAGVYRQRVNRRLCAGVGRNVTSLQAAAAALGARPVTGGDLAFELAVFPRFLLRLIWYAGDDEFSPSCTLLMPANAEAFFCTEDLVVLSESFVSAINQPRSDSKH